MDFKKKTHSCYISVYVFLHASMYVQHMHAWSLSLFWSPSAGVKDNGEGPHASSDTNPGPVQKQVLLLAVAWIQLKSVRFEPL